MPNQVNPPEKAANMRRRAEEIARENQALLPVNTSSLSPQENLHLVQELQVHQIELEMQNDELRRAQAELDAERERYFNLFELAPVGYCTLSAGGLIDKINLTATSLLGISRSALLKKHFSRFIFKEDRDIYYLHQKQLLDSGQPQAYELRLLKGDEKQWWARLVAAAAQDEEGAAVCRITLTDITSLKQAEEALKRSELRFRNVSRLSSNFAYSCIPAGQGKYAADWITDAFYTLSGYSESELKAQGCWFFTIHPDDYEAVSESLSQLKAGESDNRVFRILTRSGRVLIIANYMECQADPQSPGGLRIFGAVQDITAHKILEESLLESEEKYRSLFINMIDGYAFCKIQVDAHNKPVDFIYIDVNAAFETLTGLKKEEVLGKKVTEAIPSIKELNPELIPAYGEVALTGKPTAFEVFFKPLDKWLSVSVFSPRKYYFVAVFENITERKMSEAALKESEFKYRSLIEHSSDAVFCVDKNGVYKFVNQVFASTFSQTPAYFLGKSFWDIYTREQADYRQIVSSRVFETGETQSAEVSVPLPDKTLYFIAKANPIRDETGNIVLNLTHATDITERKQAEDNLKESLEKLNKSYLKEKNLRQELQEEANARGMFLDIVGHELRTPLTPVAVCSAMLQEMVSSQDRGIDKKLVENMFNGTQSLTKRVEELLDLCKFSRGTFTLRKQAVNVTELVKKTAARFKSLAEQQSRQLTLEIQDNLPEIEADPARFEQVLSNLLSNAVKYSPKNTTITLNAGKTDTNIVIEVQDEGTSLTPEEQKKLLDPYHRVMQDTQKYPGIGLGLAICKQIVEAHGGRISIKSRANNNTCFRVEIPVNKGREDKNETAAG